VGAYAGALGAATVGSGAAVVGNSGRDKAGSEILDGWKTMALEGKMERADEFLEKLANHKEAFTCKI
jgi:hypothetical protein